ncbi:MAG: HAD family hydrolase [Chitinispirillaceae bacterium]|jgi:putative hydrolase of the HAD superfamily|nr:HAD family hydrolase [Chitinispirillaceae bacterium]
MSALAEFARELHERAAKLPVHTLEPVICQSHCDQLTDIRAVICDVYGTLIDYWRPGLADKEERPRLFAAAFRAVADRFGFTPFLAEMDPESAPEKTLYDIYHGLIALSHEKAVKAGISFPEVKIEELWGIILLMLKRRGYDPAGRCPDLARYCAFTYNFHALGRRLYPGVSDALLELKKNNIMLGILSNAQFYTPIDLTLFLRDQTSGACEDLHELFNPELTIFSYEYKVAKPNMTLFRRLYDTLYEYHILPEQTVFIGNDLSGDIEPAARIGMRTAFFAGDKSAAYFHDRQGVVVPDIVFSSWDELPRKISFFGRTRDESGN